MRRDCIKMTHRLNWNPSGGPKEPGVRGHIAEIIFSHRIMTASPVIDLWRAITACHLHSLDITEQQKSAYHTVMDQIAAEFKDLIERRNEVVHAEWEIGHPWTFDFPGAPLSEKRGINKRGLARVPKLPRSEADLELQIAACRRVRGSLMALHWVMGICPTEVTEALVRMPNGEWRVKGAFLSSLRTRFSSPHTRA